MTTPGHYKKKHRCLCRYCNEEFFACSPKAVKCEKERCHSEAKRLERKRKRAQLTITAQTAEEQE